MNLNDQELQCLRDGISTVDQRPLSAWIIGSFARGEEIRSSDLDLMIKASRALHFAELADLRAWLDASDLPYIVDIVDYHQVTSSRLDSMLRHAKKIVDL